MPHNKLGASSIITRVLKSVEPVLCSHHVLASVQLRRYSFLYRYSFLCRAESCTERSKEPLRCRTTNLALHPSSRVSWESAGPVLCSHLVLASLQLRRYRLLYRYSYCTARKVVPRGVKSHCVTAKQTWRFIHRHVCFGSPLDQYYAPTTCWHWCCCDS